MSQPKVSMVMKAPNNWLQMIENIRTVRKKYPAPVDSMGCDQVGKNASHKDQTQRFQILVSLMLSSQTKDPITWAAVQKLKDNNIGNVDGILNTCEKDIEDLIHPVGFYRRKAVYLKKVAAILKEQYGGDIPDSIEELCKLPGVGPKMAHLCMQEAWNVNSGIGVDTHVHRIAARLGWVPSKDVKTPEHTRMALESWLPREYWREINHLLVGFGQTICTPLRPKCSECANNDLCPSSTTSRRTKSAKTLATTATVKEEKLEVAPATTATVKEEKLEVASAEATMAKKKAVKKTVVKMKQYQYAIKEFECIRPGSQADTEEEFAVPVKKEEVEEKKLEANITNKRVKREANSKVISKLEPERKSRRLRDLTPDDGYQSRDLSPVKVKMETVEMV